MNLKEVTKKWSYVSGSHVVAKRVSFIVEKAERSDGQHEAACTHDPPARKHPANNGMYQGGSQSPSLPFPLPTRDPTAASPIIQD